MPNVKIVCIDGNNVNDPDVKSFRPNILPAKKLHVWMPSTLNHGTLQCRRCLVTDKEAKFAIGPYCIN